MKYNGRVAYRVLIDQSKIAHVKGIPKVPAFWDTPRKSAYTAFLDDGLFEILIPALIPDEGDIHWGGTAKMEDVIPHSEVSWAS